MPIKPIKFYFVSPKEEYSPSGRWITDEVGLDYVKERYEEYVLPDGSIKNRWNEFDTSELSTLFLDSGGIFDALEPTIKIYNNVEVKIYQLETFYKIFKNEKYYKEYNNTKLIKFRCYIMRYAIDKKNINKLIKNIEKNKEKNDNILNTYADNFKKRFNSE